MNRDPDPVMGPGAGVRRLLLAAAPALPLLLGLTAFRADTGLADADPTEREKKLDGTFKIPNTEATIEIGGFVRLDANHDFDAIGFEDAFRPLTIPTDGREGENTRFHAKWTRVNVGFDRPTRRGPLHVFVETDFMTVDNSPRIRHAFGSLGPLLAGKTWSTFMDEDATPPTLDLEEPIAFILVRQSMVRWSHRKGDRFLWAVALEEPDAEVDPPFGVPGRSEGAWPDVTARFRISGKGGHFQAASFVGRARFRPESGSEEDERIWGLNLTGKAKTLGRDTLRFQLAYGEGLARYRGGLAAAAPGEDGRLQAIDTWAVMLSYQHYWNENLSTHAVYSHGSGDNTAGQAPGSPHALVYAALNLVWDLAEKIFFGGEWLYGSREDKDGASGHDNRLLLVFQFGFF